jgi:pyridoxine/pyridoxamine 5'-phosphate oxidase
MDIGVIRTDYFRGQLRGENLRGDPIEQFQIWLGEACAAGIISSRQVVEMEWDRLKFGEGQIPLPSFRGGYRVTPDTIGFWQGVTIACTIDYNTSGNRTVRGRFTGLAP